MSEQEMELPEAGAEGKLPLSSQKGDHLSQAIPSGGIHAETIMATNVVSGTQII